MFVDSRLEFSDAQALTVTAASTDTVDIGGDFDVGVGEPMWWILQLDVAADDGDANETYIADLETDSTSAFGSATTLATFTITRGDPAGTRFFIALPNTNEQHFRVNYTLGGTSPTVTVSTWLGYSEPTAWVSLPDGAN